MAEFTDKEIQFLFACLLCNEEPLKINFHKAAERVGMTQARNCQQKFKKLIESTKKYALHNGQVIDLEDAADGSGAVPATPTAKRGRGGKANATPRSGATTGRKRKAKADVEEAESGSEAAETPAKKRATPAKRAAAAKKSAEKVKEDSDDEGANSEEVEVAEAAKENGDVKEEASGSEAKTSDEKDGED